MQPPYLGAAYYPELWPEEQVDLDIARMQEIGLNVVRMAEFAWAFLEPREGEFTFDWLHRVIEKLHAAGIASVLGTPTPTPPAWLTEKYPDMLIQRPEGYRLVHGSRRHACPNHQAYRDYSVRIAEMMAREFGHKPGVIAWQTDNEYGCHVADCFCPTCEREWRQWLELRYGTIDRLNRAWGNGVWSQWYQSFAQIPLPLPTPHSHNPSLMLAFRRFMGESFIEHQRLHVEAMREHTRLPITHNGMSVYGHQMNYRRLFAGLDFTACDFYFQPERMWPMLADHDRFRALLPGVPHWLIETSCSWAGSHAMSGWRPQGWGRANAWMGLASGAEAVCYWLFRQQWSGIEQNHGSLLYAWGEVTPGGKEAAQVAADLRKAGDFLVATRPVAQVALTHSYESAYVFQYEPMVPGFEYRRALEEHFYLPLLRAGLMRDLVDEEGPLSDYRVLITPFLPMVPEGFRQRARAFVESGGHWIIGPMTGFRTVENTTWTTSALGGLEEVIGAEVAYRIPADPAQGLLWADGREGQALVWCEALRPRPGTEVLATHRNPLLEGLAAVTRRCLGAGTVTFLGTVPDAPLLSELLAEACREAGVIAAGCCSDSVLAVPREGGGRQGVILVEYAGKPAAVTLPYPGTELLTGKPVGTEVVLPPWGVMVVEKQEDSGSQMRD